MVGKVFTFSPLGYSHTFIEKYEFKVHIQLSFKFYDSY